MKKAFLLIIVVFCISITAFFVVGSMRSKQPRIQKDANLDEYHNTVLKAQNAFKYDYDNGATVLKIDIILTNDDMLGYIYGWKEKDYKQLQIECNDGKTSVSYNELKGIQSNLSLVSVAMDDVIAFLNQNEEVRFMVDVKTSDIMIIGDIYERVYELCDRERSILKRLIPSPQNADMIGYKSVYDYLNNIKQKPPRIIAHALGGLEQYTYLNAKEALENSYANGFTFFEVDLILSSDGKLVCMHGWREKDYKKVGLKYNEEKPIMSIDRFKDMRFHGEYTPLDFMDIADFMKQHKEVRFMLDVKPADVETIKDIYSQIYDTCDGDQSILSRLVPGAYNSVMVEGIQAIHNFDLMEYYIFPEGRREEGLEDLNSIIDFCQSKGINAISIAAGTVTSEIIDALKSKGFKVYVFTVNEVQVVSDLLTQGVDYVGTDFLLPSDLSNLE